MDAPKTAVPSPLYKPLHELTEDDIAQVTREDCRRFLKEKGMRRPSWNKCQAIQQVISLKALLEPKPHDDDDHPAGHDTATTNVPPVISPQVAHAPPTSPGNEAPNRRRGPPAPAVVTGEPSRLPPAPMPTAGPQMTIFYGGAVNVYDGMPPGKAVAILKVAASREVLPELVQPMPVQINRPLAPRPPPVPAMNHIVPPRPHSVHYTAGAMTRFPYHHRREGLDDWSSREIELEGSSGRTVSLRRYLEKRKDRKLFKCKRSIDGLATSEFELFLSQKLKPSAPFGQQCPIGKISPTHPLPPTTPARSSFVENQGQAVRFSIDLNDVDVQGV